METLIVGATHACAGTPMRSQHLPARRAATQQALARPLHPGLARVLPRSSLPGETFDEHFQGGTDLGAEFRLRMPTPEGVVRHQDEAAGAATRA